MRDLGFKPTTSFDLDIKRDYQLIVRLVNNVNITKVAKK